MTLSLVIMGLIPTEWVLFAQIIYIVAIMFSSLNIVGYYKSVQLSSGPFASTIMSWFAIVYSMIILFLPVFKTLLVGEDTPAQWRLFFFIAAGICFVTLVIWLFTVEVELRPWAVIQRKLTNSRFGRSINLDRIIGDRKFSRMDREPKKSTISTISKTSYSDIGVPKL